MLPIRPYVRAVLRTRRMAREHARKFHFLREIASGGFGSVYLAKMQSSDGFSRLVAIKLLHHRWSENKEITTRMRDEARLLGWLRHRNIVDVMELTSIDKRAAVIMEYLEAVDLKMVVQTLDERGERMPTYAALEVTSFVGSALDAAYNRPPFEGQKPLRVIHRDIKPSNIMVDESGTVKVLDFGVARGDFENRESHTSELQFGSVEYMPPERLFFEPETDRADIYSLGATLFELVAGERLGKAKGRAEKHTTFLNDRMSFLAARCPLPNPQGADLARFITEMCSYNADHRPRAEEVVQRARALARQMPGPGLTEWAETIVKPMVAEAARAPREPNPLTDSTLVEDSTLYSANEADAAIALLRDEQNGVPPPPVLTASLPAGAAAVVPAPPAASGIPAASGTPAAPVLDVPREDQRWDALKRAALAEMEMAASAALVAAPPGSAVDDEFGDEPTRIGGQMPVFATNSSAASVKPASDLGGAAQRAAKSAAATFVPDEAESDTHERKPAERTWGDSLPGNRPDPKAVAVALTPPQLHPQRAPATFTPMPSPVALRPAVVEASLPTGTASAAPNLIGVTPNAVPATDAPAAPPAAAPPTPFPVARQAVAPTAIPELAESRAPGLEFVAPVADLPASRLSAHLTMVPADDDEVDPTIMVKPLPQPQHPIEDVYFAPEPAPTSKNAPRPSMPVPGAAPRATPTAPPKPAAQKTPAATPSITPKPTPSIAPKPTPSISPNPTPKSVGPGSISPSPTRTNGSRSIAEQGSSYLDDPPPEAKSNSMMYVFAAVVTLGILGGLVLGGSFVAYRYYLASQMSAPAVPTQSAAVPTTTPASSSTPVVSGTVVSGTAAAGTAAAGTAAAGTAAPAGPNDSVFASASTETRRITASCAGKDYSGELEAVVPGPVSGSCRVTLIKKDRTRLSAEVTSAAAGRYNCFAGDAASCTK